MFETTTYLFQYITGHSSQYGAEYRVNPTARRLYQRARQEGRIAQLVSGFSGRWAERHLVALSDFTGGQGSRARHTIGIQSVRLSEIRGSVGRSHDFDVDFHPLAANTERRWLRVATARQEDFGLPAVQLIQAGRAYFVQDGHTCTCNCRNCRCKCHRVSVARARGESELDAEVSTWDPA